MAAVSKAKLKSDISAILKGADLSQLSAKKVRKQLEVKYGDDLTSRKVEIDELVMQLINDPEEEEEEVETKEAKEAPSKAASASNGNKSESESDSDISSSGSGSDVNPPDDMGSPGPKKRRKEKPARNDEELARQLQEEEAGGRRTRRNKAVAPKKSTPKATKTKAKTGEKSRKGYGAECILSPALAAVMGAKKMARSEVVKNMWAIIKERNLKDPKNGSFMICDEQMLTVFGRKRVKTFGMMKYLASHIFKTEEDYLEVYVNS